MRRTVQALLALSMGTMTVLGSCGVLGPSRLTSDRTAYNTSVARSSQEQLLLNIVRARYGEGPTILQLSGIVSGYTLGTSADLEHRIFTGGSDPASLLSRLGVRYGESPTFTYAPLEGDAFARLLLTPVPSDLIFYLSVSGWNPERVLFTVAERINGARNPLYGEGGELSQDELRFLKAARTLNDARREQRWTAGLEMAGTDKDKPAVTFRLPSDEHGQMIRELLRLDPKADTVKVVRAPAQRSSDEIAIHTAPLATIIRVLAAQIDVPPEHISDGSAAPGPDFGGAPHVIRIRTGHGAPADAYVSVPYRGHWFWIDQADYDSKQTLSLVLVLLSLQSSAAPPSTPLITIPATR